jgi:hypothetical protein
VTPISDTQIRARSFAQPLLLVTPLSRLKAANPNIDHAGHVPNTGSFDREYFVDSCLQMVWTKGPGCQ